MTYTGPAVERRSITAQMVTKPSRICPPECKRTDFGCICPKE